MSTAPEQRGPESGPREPKPAPSKPASALIFDDPLDQQSSDDTDHGWGERSGAGSDSAAELKRFLDEKPPHHF